MSARRRRAGRTAVAILLCVVSVVISGAVGRAAAPPAADTVARGKQLFKDQGCPQCHGFGGKGDGYLLNMLKEPVEMRDWTDPAALAGFDDQMLVEITKQGGEPLGKSKIMLAYGHKLSDDEIRAIVAWIRTLAAPAVTPPSP